MAPGFLPTSRAPRGSPGKGHAGPHGADWARGMARLAVAIGVLGGILVTVSYRYLLAAVPAGAGAPALGAAGVPPEGWLSPAEAEALRAEVERERLEIERERHEILKEQEEHVAWAEEWDRERDRLEIDLMAAQGEVDRLERAARKGAGGAGAGADRHTPWGPSEERAKHHPELAKFLQRHARGGEIMAAVSNGNLAYPGGMLELWIEQVLRTGVENFMVIALDEKARAFAEERGAPAFLMSMEISEIQKDTGTNHAVSALKFSLLQDFLELGYAVLLSDVDIVCLSDPFAELERDSDVEGMTDGFDDLTAYGWDDVFDDKKMGWSRYAHTMRIFVMNSGLFYIRPTEASMDLLKSIEHRLGTEKAWDQAVYNEELFFPSRPAGAGGRPARVSPQAHARVVDYRAFMNSKYLFTILRHRPTELSRARPSMVHINYHPDKPDRMRAVIDFWRNGNRNALDPFPDGSE